MSWTPPPTGKVWTPGPLASDPVPPPAATGAMPWERGKVWVPGQTPAADPEPEQRIEVPVEPQGGLVKAWSASILDKFESCPYQIFLGKVKKVKEEKSEAADRGSLIHQLAEDYVKGEIGERPKELEQYAPQFDRLRERYTEGHLHLEEDWGFDINWEATGWMAKNIWARMKLDVFDRESEESGKVIDHKTGKKWGNEVKHNRQAMIYAIGAFKRFPVLEFVTTEFWYLDQKDGPLVNTYNRQKIAILEPRVTARAIRMTSATKFDPKPNEQNCRFCPYAKNGACEWSFYR